MSSEKQHWVPRPPTIDEDAEFVGNPLAVVKDSLTTARRVFYRYPMKDFPVNPNVFDGSSFEPIINAIADMKDYKIKAMSKRRMKKLVKAKWIHFNQPNGS